MAHQEGCDCPDCRPITQAEINAACRKLAAEGRIEWDEVHLKARLTPREQARVLKGRRMKRRGS
jgi:hypothetical protein